MKVFLSIAPISALVTVLMFSIGSPLGARADSASLGMTVGVSLKPAMTEVLTPRSVECSLEAPPVELQLGSIEFTDMSGSSVSTESLREKNVVLYFWSIYCRGCVGAMKDLEALREDLAKENTELITIHLFEPKMPKLAAAVRRLGIRLPILLAPKQVRELFSIKLLPTSLVFNKEHRLVARLEGVTDKDGLRLNIFGKLSTELNATDQNKNQSLRSE